MKNALAVAAIALSFLAVLFVISARFNEGANRRHDICVQIEMLKRAQRDQALSDYSKLDANLRLLHIKKTPAIVAAAKASRDTKLRRFAAHPCD